MPNVIEVADKDYKDLYEGWIHKALETEGFVMGKYSDQELLLLNKFIGFTYQILTAIGIIAGFGFTAIQNVRSVLLFTLGESVLVAAILFGLFWVKKFYENNISAIQKTSNGLFDIYRARDKIFLKINNDYAKTHKIDGEDIVEAQKKDQEVLEFIGGRDQRKKKGEFVPHTVTLILSAIGFALILLSFNLSFDISDLCIVRDIKLLRC